MIQRSESTRNTQSIVPHKKQSDFQDIIRPYSTLEAIKQKAYNMVHKKKQSIQLDQLLDPDTQFQLAQEKRANLVPAETLYSHGITGSQQKVFQHFSKETVLCCKKEDQISLDFLAKESRPQLLNQGYDNIHLGLIVIGIQGLHRKHFGSKVFIALIDDRQQNLEKAIIGEMEVDLKNNSELVYLVPDFQLTINDFAEHIKLIIKTKGYEDMNSGEANLVITKALSARVGNSLNTNFKLDLDNVLTYLGSKGIMTIPGKQFDSNLLNGEEWTIRLPNQNPIGTQPTSAQFWKHSDGSLTTRFSTYVPRSKPLIDSDDDTPTTVLVLEEPELINFEEQQELPKQEEDYYTTLLVENLTYPVKVLEVCDTELPYPTYMADISSSSSVPQTTVTGPPIFGPAYQPRQPLATPQDFGLQPTVRTRGKPLIFDSLQTLPQANTNTGSMLQLELDLAHWEERIRRWESNTIAHTSTLQFSDDTEKVIYIENLLGETAKLYFQNWKSAYPNEYNNLIRIAGDTINFTTQLRQMLLGYDEYRGYIEMQSQALLDIERLSITNMKDIQIYSNNYLNLASKTGQAFLSQELSDKYFRKMPPPFNSKLAELWQQKNPAMTIGIAPRIHFTYQVLQDLCRQNELNRQAKDFSFCREIEVSGEYGTRKPYRKLRRSTTYKGKHPQVVRSPI